MDPDPKPAPQYSSSMRLSLAFIFLLLAIQTAVTTFIAIENSSDLWEIALIVIINLLVQLLYLGFLCIIRLPADSPHRARLKAPVLVVLTATFLLNAYVHSVGAPLVLAAAVWLVALSGCGFFYWFIFLRKPRSDGDSGCVADCDPDSKSSVVDSKSSVIDSKSTVIDV